MKIIIDFGLNFLNAFEFCIFLAVVLSWFPEARRNKISIFVMQIAGPVLRVARKFTPRFGMIDFSPLIVILLIQILRRALLSILVSI